MKVQKNWIIYNPLYHHHKSLSGQISFSVLIIFPWGVIQWTDTSLLEPSSDAVMMEGVVADSPSNDALFGGLLILIRLAVDAGLHHVAFADSAVFYFDIPRPQSNCSPFFDFESFNMLLRIFLFHSLIIFKRLN